MTTVPRWSGREARALREAKRMSLRDFALHLGVNDAAVSRWERRGSLARLRYETQQILDTDLARSSEDVRERFRLLLAGQAASSAAPQQWGDAASWSGRQEATVTEPERSPGYRHEPRSRC